MIPYILGVITGIPLGVTWLFVANNFVRSGRRKR